MIISAERRFPVRIRVGAPPGGFGHRYAQITALLDKKLLCRWLGHDTFRVARVLNDAISLYFADATLASAFVARWCVAAKVETTGGVFHVREDEPAPRIGSELHRTP
jgi:hypothetical protein